MIEIDTERLTLKKLVSADKDLLIDLIGDFRVSETLSNVPHPYTDEDAEYWLEKVSESEFSLNIFLNDVLIGGVGLKPKEDDLCFLEYWLGFEYWGQGYASEAARGLLDYAKTNTSFKRVKSNVHRGNIESSKVLEKIGFKRVGEGEDFSISKQENIPTINYEYFFPSK